MTRDEWFAKQRKEQREAARLEYQARRQAAMQTGAQEKWNRAVGTDAEEMIWLDVMMPED